MNEKIKKVHDHFFKMAMQDMRVAVEFFQMHLPKDIQQLVQWKSLESYPSVQNPVLSREDITDVVYKVMLQENIAFLHLVVDHQSTPDPLMAFRAENYRNNLIAHYVWQNPEAKKLPLVISLVLYHGKTPWKYDTDLRSIVDAPKHLVKKYAFQPFILIDLNTIEDRVLREALWAGVMQLTLKHIFAQDVLPHLEAMADFLRYLERANGGSFVELVLEYILKRGEMDKQAFVQFIKTQLSSDQRGDIMTVAEQFIAEGVQKGMQQGMHEGIHLAARRMLRFGTSVEEVAKILDLDPVEVQKELDKLN